MTTEPILNLNDLKKQLRALAELLLQDVLKTLAKQGIQVQAVNPEATDQKIREVLVARLVDVLMHYLPGRLAVVGLTDRANALAYAAGGMPFERSKTDKDSLMARLLEESGELAEASLLALLLNAGRLAGASKSYFGRPTRPDVIAGDLTKVHDELGDVGVIWLRICHIFGADPFLVISASLDKFSSRIQASSTQSADRL